MYINSININIFIYINILFNAFILNVISQMNFANKRIQHVKYTMNWSNSGQFSLYIYINYWMIHFDVMLKINSDMI